MLYDGNPGTPDLGVLWDLAERGGRHVLRHERRLHRATARRPASAAVARAATSRALRSVGSTGSPLSPEGFAWVYESIHEDIWLFSTSGGTDVGTAFVGGVPTLPVYQGELQARSLGVKLEAWSPEGKPLIGEVGELVITEPMPSMPIYFWGDADGSRYRESYFEMFPGIWRHGDWIEITDRGTAIISRPLRRDDQPRRRPDGHERDLPGRPHPRRGRRRARARPAAARHRRLHAALRRPPRRRHPRRRPHRPDPAADPRGLLPPPRPRPRSSRSPRSPAPSRARCSSSPSSGSCSAPPADTTVSRDALATPAALDPFEEMARRPPYARPKLVFANIVRIPRTEGQER